MKAQKKLMEQKQGMDYSRSLGGEKLLDKAMTMTAAAIGDRLERATQKAAWGASYIGPLYQRRKL